MTTQSDILRQAAEALRGSLVDQIRGHLIDGATEIEELTREVAQLRAAVQEWLDGPCVFGGLESGHCILGLSVESSTEPHVIKQIENALNDCRDGIEKGVSAYIRGCIADYRAATSNKVGDDFPIAENDRFRKALYFYAERQHLFPSIWKWEIGRPYRDHSTARAADSIFPVEDGQIARAALHGEIRKAVVGDIIPGCWEPYNWTWSEAQVSSWRTLLQKCVDGWKRGADIIEPMAAAEKALACHPDPTGQTREPTPGRLLTVWKTVQKITDELARADHFSGETIKELVEAADYLLCYHHTLLQRPLHPDPTGKTREPPHCPTCACGLTPGVDIRPIITGIADGILGTHGSAKKIDDEFKNFHRLLCERFGAVHDERDWRRDQASLIEHIAKCRLDAEYEQVGVLNCSYEGFTTCEGASGEPVYRKRKSL